MASDMRVYSYCDGRTPERHRSVLLPDQRNLQVGGAVLLGIEAAAVDIAGAPEQQVAPEIDEVVLHEIRPFLETEGCEDLSEYALGRVDRPRRVSGRRDLVEYVGKPLNERSYLVGLISNEVDLLRPRCDRMGALPLHVPADLDPRERHGTIGVGRVDDLKFEPIERQIFESALEIERLERAVRVLARPYLRSDALPVSEHRLLDLGYIQFHVVCPRLIAGGLCRGSPNPAITRSNNSDALIPLHMRTLRCR